MKSDAFITKLAHGAVVSAMATVLMAKHQTSTALVPALDHESTLVDPAIGTEEGTQTEPDNSLVLKLPPLPTEWDKKLEREFRQLALKEATGEITAGEANRLDGLNYWRNRLVTPPTADEILTQIKRDRILEKMESLLREYVEFQESTSQKRNSTC